MIGIIVAIISLVLVVLAFLGTIYITIRILRKPGYRLDDTRRWVDYTKGGLSFWLAAQLVQVIMVIVAIAAGVRNIDLYFDSVARRVTQSLAFVSHAFGVLAHVCITLAFFYLSHALTQLRNPGQEDSSKYRKGRVWALGAAGLVAGLTVVAFALWLSVTTPNYYYYDDGYRMRSLVAQCFNMACLGILTIFAVANVVYSAKARKKALGSPLQKAAKILVICTSLWLVRMVWTVVSFFFVGIGGIVAFHVVFTFLEIILSIGLGLAILYMLYRLASRESYALSKASYRAGGKTGDAEQTI